MKPTRIEVVILLLAMLLAWAWFAPSIHWAPVRSGASLVRADMRSIATALEAYRTDLGAYPPSTASQRLPRASLALTAPLGDDFFLAHRYTNSLLTSWYAPYVLAILFVCLAVPGVIVWIKRPIWTGRKKMAAIAWGVLAFVCLFGIACPVVNFGPGYVPRPGATDDSDSLLFRYFTDGTTGWMLLSVGPDEDVDYRPPDDLEYEGVAMIESLLPFSYDPTNGTVSSGDIWRVSQ